MLLFKAYVMPVMTFGSDVVVYTNKTINCLNKLMIRYCRWSLGLGVQKILIVCILCESSVFAL